MGVGGGFWKTKIFFPCTAVKIGYFKIQNLEMLFIQQVVIPPKAVQFYKINGNGKEWWMLFKVRIFTQDGALTQQLLYTN